jgi:hypothetical protein
LLLSRPAGGGSFYRRQKVARKTGSFPRYGLIGYGGRKLVQVRGLGESARYERAKPDLGRVAVEFDGQVLERVGRSRLGRSDARGALQLAEQAITLDGLHEPSWRLALQAEHSLGLRESVARRYDELARSLDEQLGLEPARETRLIYRQLLGQN